MRNHSIFAISTFGYLYSTKRYQFVTYGKTMQFNVKKKKKRQKKEKKE